MPAHKQHLPTRFWAKVEKTDGCWLWTGKRNQHGYGMIEEKGKYIRAHRRAYELTHGPFPPELKVLHRCDNPPCVNPDHLFLGTQADNVADMQSKGRARKRAPRGEANPKAKLRLVDVRAIRARYAAGEASQHQLAREYGVWQGTINAIIQNRHWKESPDESANK